MDNQKDEFDFDELVLNAIKYPQHQGVLNDYNQLLKANNPICNDAVMYYCLVKEGILEQISFNVSGCALSRAATSLLADEAFGARAEDLLQVAKNRLNISNNRSLEIKTPLDYLINSSLKTPLRLNCALLPLRALIGLEY